MAINQTEIDRILADLLADVRKDESHRSVANTEITALYTTVKVGFREILKRAERVSMGSAGIPSTGNRMFWASVLFTRLVVISKSIDKLIPNTKPREHWDFGSVASLVRNLSEAYLNYFPFIPFTHGQARFDDPSWGDRFGVSQRLAIR